MDDVGAVAKQLIAGFMLQSGNPPPPTPPTAGQQETGGDNGGMESRVAKLEAASEFIVRDIAEIKADLRTLAGKVDRHFMILAGMIVTLGIGMAGLMAKGFGWL